MTDTEDPTVTAVLTGVRRARARTPQRMPPPLPARFLPVSESDHVAASPDSTTVNDN